MTNEIWRIAKSANDANLHLIVTFITCRIVAFNHDSTVSPDTEATRHTHTRTRTQRRTMLSRSTRTSESSERDSFESDNNTFICDLAFMNRPFSVFIVDSSSFFVSTRRARIARFVAVVFGRNPFAAWALLFKFNYCVSDIRHQCRHQAHLHSPRLLVLFAFQSQSDVLPGILPLHFARCSCCCFRYCCCCRRSRRRLFLIILTFEIVGRTLGPTSNNEYNGSFAYIQFRIDRKLEISVLLVFAFVVLQLTNSWLWWWWCASFYWKTLSN